jgi:hypothetical protein
MRSLICRLFGHDHMLNGARNRTCLRCGMRETLRDLGHVLAWVEVTGVMVKGRR